MLSCSQRQTTREFRQSAGTKAVQPENKNGAEKFPRRACAPIQAAAIVINCRFRQPPTHRCKGVFSSAITAISLAPGFSPVWSVRVSHSRFNGLCVLLEAAEAAGTSGPPEITGLKPGANENKTPPTFLETHLKPQRAASRGFRGSRAAIGRGRVCRRRCC